MHGWVLTEVPVTCSLRLRGAQAVESESDVALRVRLALALRLSRPGDRASDAHRHWRHSPASTTRIGMMYTRVHIYNRIILKIRLVLSHYSELTLFELRRPGPGSDFDSELPLGPLAVLAGRGTQIWS